MNIPKAIELNKQSEYSLRRGKHYDHADAVKLGNEALKRLNDVRLWHPAGLRKPLPGETEE